MVSLARVGSLCLLTVLVAAGCSSQEELDEGSDDLTGGSAKVEPPTVYFYDQAQKLTCVGALLDESVAVTTKNCAKVGLTAVRPGTSIAKAKVVEVNVPKDDKDAEIAVVALDGKMPGPFAIITQAPLRDGYTVNGVDTTAATSVTETTATTETDAEGSAPKIGVGSAAGRGIAVDVTKTGADGVDPKVPTASIEAEMVSETDTHGSIIGKGDARICASEIGAPVCSSVDRTCGLAGIIVGAPESKTASEERSALDAACPAGAWKVAPLGRHAAFLKALAPKAFEPIEIVKRLRPDETFRPKGMWGYEAKGTIDSCRIETEKLDPVKVGSPAKVKAKVRFSKMAKEATRWGRFGIARKATPSAIRWLPANGHVPFLSDFPLLDDAFDVNFDADLKSEELGDFAIVFRVSTTGGETWTACDAGGVVDGASAPKALALSVVEELPAPGKDPVPGEVTRPGGSTNPPRPTEPTKPTDPGEEETEEPTTGPNKSAEPEATKPQDIPPSPTAPTGAADERAEPNDEASVGQSDPGDEDDDVSAPEKPASSNRKKVKKPAAAGCSAAPASRGAGTNMAMFGVAAVAAVIARRRKRQP